MRPDLLQGLNPQQHQGDYGEAVVQALCTAAGLNLGRFARDDGIDFIITKGGRKKRRAPYLDVQVKSCSTLREHSGAWRYNLDANTFDQLSCDDPVGPPQFLFLVNVPPNPIDYLTVTHDQLILHSAVYWQSFEGASDGQRYASTRTVTIPRINLLTPEALSELFEKASQQYRRLPSTSPRGNA